VNYEVGVDDDALGVDSTLLVEGQTVAEQVTDLALGEGAGVNAAEFNRQQKSKEDVTEPGSVYDSERIADGAIETQKLVDLSITETKIQDDSISTPKLQAEAVTANKILANTITAALIDTLNLATGELSVGSGNDGLIEFDDLTISGTNQTVTVMLPSSNENALLGLSGTRFAEIFVRDVNCDEVITDEHNVDDELNDLDSRVTALENA
jgi:hypothetical protein